MKRTNFILNGFLALAIVLVFAQCSDKNNNAATSSAAPAAGVAGSSNMKIAYVEIPYEYYSFCSAIGDYRGTVKGVYRNYKEDDCPV